jgi:hypothetical protein
MLPPSEGRGVSDDEVFATVVSVALAAVGWFRWVRRALRPPEMAEKLERRWALLLAPSICGLILLLVLWSWSAADVRTDAAYIAMYAAMGAAWVIAGMYAARLFGVMPAEDIIGRRNAAASPAVAGALVGLTLCFAGANIGDGPGWWVVVFSAGAATLGWLAIWALADALGGVTRAVLVERDPAAGLRLGAMLAGAGLILGRGAAGNWHSAADTLSDLSRDAWPALGYVLAEALIGLAARPRPEQPRAPLAALGVAPALVYVGGAVLWVVALGWWA